MVCSLSLVVFISALEKKHKIKYMVPARKFNNFSKDIRNYYLLVVI